MDNQNQFPKNESDLYLNKSDGSKDTFSDRSINQQAQIVQATKADKSVILRVKIIAGVLLFWGLSFIAQAMPILVSIVSGSSEFRTETFTLGVTGIFQGVIGVLSSISGILLLRWGKGARILVILTTIIMFVSEIVLISQGGSLFYWIFLLKPWFISLSLLFFLCIFSIRVVTSKDVKSLFAKPQQIVTVKVQPISKASVLQANQIAETVQEESDDSRTRHNVKIIGFIGIVFSFIVLISFVPRLEIFTPSVQEQRLLPVIRELVILYSSIFIFIAGIGLAQCKKWGRLMFKIVSILLAVFAGAYTAYLLCFLPSMASLPQGITFFTLLSWIVLFTLLLIGLILIIRYLGKEKVKKVCNWDSLNNNVAK